MIKGVSKYIIEINDTENLIFEKIICYVRPEFRRSRESELKREALKYTSVMFDDEEFYKKTPFLKRIPSWILAAGSAGIVGTVFLIISKL